MLYDHIQHVYDFIQCIDFHVIIFALCICLFRSYYSFDVQVVQYHLDFVAYTMYVTVTKSCLVCFYTKYYYSDGNDV